MRCLRCGQMITESYSHNKAEHPLCIRCMIKEGKALIKENEEEFGNLSNLPKLNGEQTFERDTFIDILNNFIALEGCKATLLFSPTSIKKDVVFNNKTDLANTRFETYIELLNCPASIEETQDGYTIVVDTSELEFTEEDIDAFVNDLVQPDGDVVYEAASTIDELNDELNKVMREFVAEVNDDKKEYDRQDLERIQNAYFDKIEKVILSTTVEVSLQSVEEVVNAVRDEMESIMNKYPEYSEYQNRNYFGTVTEAMLEDAQYDMDIEDANDRLNSLIKDMREYVKTERESGCPDKEIIRLIKSPKKGFNRQLTLILDRSHLSQEDESKARKSIENMMNTLEFKDSNILESKDFKYSDEDEVEYKGYTIAPFTINNIKVGNKSVGGFTKYFIKKGDAYYKDKDFTSVEDAKKFIDSAIKGMRTVLASELKKGDVILDNKNKPYKITSIDYEDGYVSLYADNLTEIGNARFTFDNDEVVILRDSAIEESTDEDYTNSTYTNGNYTLKILNKVKPGEYGVNNAYNVEWNGNKQKLSAEGISMVIRHNKMHKISDSAIKVKESIEYDFEDITNMSDAKIILKKYGIDLIKKDSRNYVLRKDGKEYTFYVLDNPNEVRKDLVKAVNKLTESINENIYSKLYHYSNTLYNVGDEITKSVKLSPEIIRAYKNEIGLDADKLVYMLDHKDEDYADIYKYCYEVSVPSTRKAKMDYSPIICQDYLDRVNKKFDANKVAESFAKLYNGIKDSDILSLLGLPDSDKEEFIADKGVKVVAVEETNANIDEAYREPVDDLAVSELVLYIKNDSQIYNTCTMAVVKNLARKKSKGVYDKDLAVKAFEYVAKVGANKYTKEFGGTFNPATRNAVAKELLNKYEDYIEELANKKKVKESIDYTDENYLYIPYWYLTKHGMGPGSVPPKMSIWTWFETPEGTYFASSKVLNTQELKEYEIVEKHPRLEDIPEKSRVDIQDFLEEPISDEDKNIVSKENLNIKEDLSDNQYEMIEELADKITNYNGAEYRGAKIPSPQRGYINQSNLDDELRLKYIDYEINDNNIAISYITQGPFEYHQGKQIEKEIIRATNYWVSKLGIDFPITLDIDVVCRDGAHYGHYNNSVKVENGTDLSKLKEDYEVVDTYYMVDIDSDIKADSATKQEAIDIVNKAKSNVKDYVYVTRATTYFRDGREEKSFEDVIDAYIKDGKWVVKKDMFGLLKQTESFKVVDKNGKKVPQGGGFTSRKEAEMFAAQYGEKDLKVVKESTIKTSKNTLKSLDEDWGDGYAYLRLYVYSGEDQEVELGIDEFHYNSDFKISQKNKAIAQAKKFVSDFNNNKINDDRLKTPFYVAVKYIEYDDEEDDFEADDIYIINSNGKELTESIGESYKDKPMSYEQAKKYLKDKRNIDLTKDMYQDIMALAGVKKLKESYSQSVSFWDWANSVARSEGTLITPVSKEADNLLQDGEDEDYVNESDLPKLKSIVDEFSYYLYDNKREQNVYAIANGQIYFSYDRVLYMNKKDADYFAKNYDLVVNKVTVNFDDLMVEDTNESFGIGLPESKEEK